MNYHFNCSSRKMANDILSKLSKREKTAVTWKWSKNAQWRS